MACAAGAAFTCVGSVLGGAAEGATNLASQKKLPEGKGLAAPFPADAGVRTHPAVIFAEDFESGTIGASWDETGNKGGKVLQLVPPGEPGLGQFQGPATAVNLLHHCRRENFLADQMI